MTTPAAWLVAAAAWLGALAGAPDRTLALWPAAWPPMAALALAALGLGLGVMAWRQPDRADDLDPGGRAARASRLALLALAIALVAAGSAGARTAVAEQGVLAQEAQAGTTGVVEAVAVTDLRGTHGGWQVVRVEELDGRALRERAWWWLDAGVAPPTVGERVSARVTLGPLEPEGLEAHVARLGASARLRVHGEPEPLEAPGWLLASTQGARDRFAAVAHAALPEERAAVLTALVTGDRRGEPPVLREQLSQAGLAHLVVVSGRHVGVLLAGVLATSALLGAGVRGRRLVALACLAWFAVLTRWQPSVLRASGMAALVLAAGISGRGSEPRHALATAVTVLLLLDPRLASQLGFGLSVSATAGVLVVAPWLADRLPGPRALALPVAVTLGAQLGAAPLLLTMDGIGAGSVPANVIAVPAAALAQTLGVVAALLAQAWPAAAGVLAAAAGAPVAVIVWAAETFSAGPRLTGQALASPWPWALAGSALGVLALRRRAPRLALATGCLVAVVALAPLPGRGPADVDALTVTFLDVGQALAVLVEVPDDDGGTARLLYDAGLEADDAVDHLADRGVTALDAMVLSHPHHDHSGGMPAVLREHEVAALLVGPDPIGEEHARSVHETYAWARAQDVPLVPVTGGQAFALGSAQVTVLGPPADGSLPASEPNEVSVVLEVVHDEARLLLTGDAELASQRHLLATHPERLPAALLQVAHHGGDTNAPGFHVAVGAEVGVISAGRDNSYGHPHPEVLADLAAAGTRVYRTDQHGTVEVTFEGPRPRATPQRQPRRTAVTPQACASRARRARRNRRCSSASAPVTARQRAASGSSSRTTPWRRARSVSSRSLITTTPRPSCWSSAAWAQARARPSRSAPSARTAVTP